MATIKNSQTISRSRSNNKGFVTILLLITWVVIALGYYGIKTGMLQSDASNPAVDAKIAEIESKNTALESRVSTLEKKLIDVGSALTPSLTPAITPTNPVNTTETPADATKPVDTTNPAPVTEEKKPEAGNNTLPDPSSLEPKADDNKTDPTTKPQTNNQSDKDNRAALEKKSVNQIAIN